ncbi:Hypothetical protein UVM_LOCUS181 [uncultured virus]|nr:Hypothetical protein UVM_LOCUS181 [uncultured virus]
MQRRGNTNDEFVSYGTEYVISGGSGSTQLDNYLGCKTNANVIRWAQWVTSAANSSGSSENIVKIKLVPASLQPSTEPVRYGDLVVIRGTPCGLPSMLATNVAGCDLGVAWIPDTLVGTSGRGVVDDRAVWVMAAADARPFGSPVVYGTGIELQSGYWTDTPTALRFGNDCGPLVDTNVTLRKPDRDTRYGVFFWREVRPQPVPSPLVPPAKSGWPTWAWILLALGAIALLVVLMMLIFRRRPAAPPVVLQ